MPKSPVNTRRALLAAIAAHRALPQTPTSPAKPKEHDFMGLKHTMPDQPEQIAMLVYPGMTALDLIGPQQIFGYTMGAKVDLVWKTRDPIVTDTRVSLLPTQTFDSCPKQVDILFVPGGGRETVDLMQDAEVLAFLRDRAASARYVTSVCSGALILGAAGLLDGYKATTHWAVHDVLPLLGATPVKARVVEDRNRITAGGITSGIDFALRIAAKLRGDDYARALELMVEYDPQPPFRTGTLAKAGRKVGRAITAMYQPLNQRAKAAAGRSRPAV
jgi:cyclohexyl-isocyanide hydratase